MTTVEVPTIESVGLRVVRTPGDPALPQFLQDNHMDIRPAEGMTRTTRQGDLTAKKDIYEKILKTHEYFAYDPDSRELLGWRLGKTYASIEPDARGWFWSEQLGLWIGPWQGVYLGYDLLWLRFFDTEGNLVPTFAEAAQKKAELAKRQADAAEQQLGIARQEADALTAELAQLRAQSQKNA